MFYINKIIITLLSLCALISIAGATNIYIIDDHHNNVAVFDAATKEHITTIPVGQNPALDIAVGNKVFVSNSGSSTVSVINAKTNKLTTDIYVGNCPQKLISDGSYVYVENLGDNTVSMINIAKNKVTRTLKFDYVRDIAVSGGKLYVLELDKISVVDTKTFKTSTIPIADNICKLTVTGNKLYLVNTDNQMIIINLKNNKVIKTLQIGINPSCIMNDGLYVYLSTYSTSSACGALTKISVKTDNVMSVLNLLYPGCFDLHNGKIYVTSPKIICLYIIDNKKMTLLDTMRFDDGINPPEIFATSGVCAAR